MTTDQTPLNPDALEAAVKALDENFNPEKYPIMAAMFRDYAEAAVSAYLTVAQPVVNSVEELDALPAGSLVRTANGREFYKAPLIDYPWSQGREHDRSSSRYVGHYGPVTVVHRPEVNN